MTSDSTLKNKKILVVDDEPDILAVVEEVLDMCYIDKASDYNTGAQSLRSFTYDIVILDIMGVNGFDLLKVSVDRGFPTVMLTAHALSPDSLKNAIKLGAVSFLPKEKLPELKTFLEDVVLGGGKPVWQRLFDKLGDFFNTRFGSDWLDRDEFFKDFIEKIKKEQQLEAGQ